MESEVLRVSPPDLPTIFDWIRINTRDYQPSAVGSKNLSESQTSSQICKVYISEKNEVVPNTGPESRQLSPPSWNFIIKDTIGLPMGCVSPGHTTTLKNI